MKKAQGFAFLVKKGSRAFLACAVFLLVAFSLHAQQEGRGLTPAQNIIEMDIRTSTLSELAAWSRRHGLPEGGTAADLARRLREHYGLPLEGAAVEDGQRVITIESARVTEYFTIYEVDEEYARLSGDVVISLREGDVHHEIRAWEILFNRTRNILSATGGVIYVRTEGDTIETFRGESIVVNLDNWVSAFVDGVSERLIDDDGSVFLFAGEVISLDDEDTTVLRRATISSADEESLWSLRASRVWLLPGGDFAILNAVLRVGEIPVFYFPAFFFPADQMLVHPAIGTRVREGNFLNTTTYILGRPRNVGGEERSFVTIMGVGEDMELVREGLFLRSTGRRADQTAEPSLSLLVDFYTNLGAYIGAEFSMPRTGILSELSVSAGLGFSRTLAPMPGGWWTPYYPGFDGATDRNRGRIFGTEVPFRYRLLVDGAIGGRFGTFSWRVPLHSDPYMDSDFITNRVVGMDWFNLLQQGGAVADAPGDRARLNNYIWDFRATLRPSFPDMRPFVNNISIGTITSSVHFARNTAVPPGWTGIAAHSPMRFFFSPRHAILYSVSGTITGTPLRWGGAAAAPPQPDEPSENLAALPGTPISPFAPREEPDLPPPRDPADVLVPPALAQRFTLPTVGGDTVFTVNYNLSPTSMTRLDFDHTGWTEADDVDWGDISTIQTNIAGRGEIGLGFQFRGQFITSSFTFSGDGRWHHLPFLYEDAHEFTHGNAAPAVVEQRIAARREREYRQTNFSTLYALDTSFRPFLGHSVFGASRLRHVLRGDVIGAEFVGTGANPDWDFIHGEWSRERIRAHELVAEVSANVMDNMQRLTFTTHLTPMIPAYLFRGEFNVWNTRTTADWGIRFPDDEPAAHDPFNIATTINLGGNFANISQSVQIDTEEWEMTRLMSQLSFPRWGFLFRFRAAHMEEFSFVPNLTPGTPGYGWGEWVRGTDLAMRPQDFFMQFGRRFDMRFGHINIDNIFVRLDSSTTFDLQRYDNSRFTFGIGAGFETRHMRVSFGANSVNDAIFRYFMNLPMFSGFPQHLIPHGRQTNIFFDLLDSFNFFDESARRRSGFKIRDFVIDVRRFFGDWEASLNWRMTPHRPDRPGANWEMSRFVTFSVTWMPIPEFRAEIDYDQTRSPRWMMEGM